MSSAGVGPLCFIKSKVNAAIYQEILEHFMLPCIYASIYAHKLYGDADFPFQQDFSTCPQCQNHFQVVCWPWYYCAYYLTCLRLGVTNTSSVWLPLQDESLYVFPNCKSLWIKESAKWLNVNVKCLIGQPTCLTWTPDGIYGIFSRERWETINLTIQTSWRLNSASAEPQADRFHATPHWCWSLC